MKWKISFAFCGRILEVLRRNPGQGWGDCFASLRFALLATTKNTVGLLRFACNGPFICHCEVVFFASEAVSPFRLLGSHCELVFTFAKQSLPLSPWGNTVEIRDCFASLAVTPFCVPARLSSRFRSSLAFRLLGSHCELVFTFAKQSLPLSPWGNTVEIRDCFAALQ